MLARTLKISIPFLSPRITPKSIDLISPQSPTTPSYFKNYHFTSSNTNIISLNIKNKHSFFTLSKAQDNLNDEEMCYLLIFQMNKCLLNGSVEQILLFKQKIYQLISKYQEMMATTENQIYLCLKLVLTVLDSQEFCLKTKIQTLIDLSNQFEEYKNSIVVRNIIYHWIVDLSIKQCDEHQALQYNYKLLDLLPNQKPEQKLKIYRQMINIYAKLKEEPKMIEYFQKSIDLFQQVNNEEYQVWILQAYAYIGMQQFNRKNCDKAINYLNKTISIYEKHKLVFPQYVLSIFWLSKALRELGQLKEAIYQMQKAFEICQKHYNKLVQQSDLIPDIIDAKKLEIIPLYIQNDQFMKAIILLEYFANKISVTNKDSLETYLRIKMNILTCYAMLGNNDEQIPIIKQLIILLQSNSIKASQQVLMMKLHLNDLCLRNSLCEQSIQVLKNTEKDVIQWARLAQNPSMINIHIAMLRNMRQKISNLKKTNSS